MIKVFDDRKRELLLARPPARIVSLVPSETETLFALGAGARVAGRTDYCVEPAGAVADIPTVGGTKTVDVDAVSALAPDLVIANQEENERAVLEQIAQRGVPVFVSFVKRVGDAVAHLARLARLLDVAGEPDVRALLRRAYEVVRDAEAARRSDASPVFVPIWRKPLMTIGGDTYGSDMLSLAGGANVFAGASARYPTVELDDVCARQLAFALLPDEPHRFTDDEAAAFTARGLQVRRCDGKDLFWYGARSLDALPRLAAALGV